MGNIVEAGGFGDTRLPSDDEEYLDESSTAIMKQNIDPSMFTYRNGVNYIKED